MLLVCCRAWWRAQRDWRDWWLSHHPLLCCTLVRAPLRLCDALCAVRYAVLCVPCAVCVAAAALPLSLVRRRRRATGDGRWGDGRRATDDNAGQLARREDSGGDCVLCAVCCVLGAGCCALCRLLRVGAVDGANRLLSTIAYMSAFARSSATASDSSSPLFSAGPAPPCVSLCTVRSA